MLDIDFETIEDGMEKYKAAVSIRNQMGGALYYNICDDDCLRMADALSRAGADRNEIAEIGGYTLRY